MSDSTPVRVRYQTIELTGIDIHLKTLRDRQQFDERSSSQHLDVPISSWPLFGVVWASSRFLANHVQGVEVEGKRILEVGCGIGLTSLVLNGMGADITATDYNPSAGEFLLINAGLNPGPEIPFVRTAWADENLELGLFDLIVGSDLLYEPDHVQLLSAFIARHAKPECEVLLVDPGRGQVGRFARAMEVFGFDCAKHAALSDGIEGGAVGFSGQLLVCTREER